MSATFFRWSATQTSPPTNTQLFFLTRKTSPTSVSLQKQQSKIPRSLNYHFRLRFFPPENNKDCFSAIKMCCTVGCNVVIVSMKYVPLGCHNSLSHGVLERSSSCARAFINRCSFSVRAFELLNKRNAISDCIHACTVISLAEMACIVTEYSSVQSLNFKKCCSSHTLIILISISQEEFWSLANNSNVRKRFPRWKILCKNILQADVLNRRIRRQTLI